jgi:uncharacterized cofD-like protein
VSSKPAIVAIGGGHGLAVALRAAQRYAGSITAVVSVADDGGSSGRLRRDFGVPAPGDLRKALVALARPGTVWADVFEHRFDGGELGGHALGNLVLVGLEATMGDFVGALDEAGRLLDAAGRVLPATVESVVLKARAAGAEVRGQVAVGNTSGIGRVQLVPADAAAPPEAVAAIEAADQVVLGPGSLFTSVLPVVCVPQLRAALAGTAAQVVMVANVAAQPAETSGLDATDHLRVAREHGARVDVFLYASNGRLAADEDVIRSWGVEPVAAAVAGPDQLAHDPEQLATALGALL